MQLSYKSNNLEKLNFLSRGVAHVFYNKINTGYSAFQVVSVQYNARRTTPSSICCFLITLSLSLCLFSVTCSEFWNRFRVLHTRSLNGNLVLGDFDGRQWSWWGYRTLTLQKQLCNDGNKELKAVSNKICPTVVYSVINRCKVVLLCCKRRDNL